MYDDGFSFYRSLPHLMVISYVQYVLRFEEDGMRRLRVRGAIGIHKMVWRKGAVFSSSENSGLGK